MMKTLVTACFSFLLVLGLWQTSSPAQRHEPPPRAEGSLKGLVLDGNESRIAGAKITLENKEYRFEGWSDEKGAFEVKAPAGEYRLKIENHGFKPYVRRRVRIEAGKTETIRQTLWPGPPPGLEKVFIN